MINRRLKLQEPSTSTLRPHPAAAKGHDMAFVYDENGKASLVPEDPRDIFNDPFASFTEWDGEADHKAYDEL